MSNKKIFIAFGIGLLFISLAIAGVFILRTFDFTFTVQEPLSIEYAWEEYPYDCGRNTNFSAFSGNVDPGRIIYPGNLETICFKFHSLSNGHIPLFVNYTEGIGIGSSILDFPSQLRPGDSYGVLNFTVAPDADGVFLGNIIFGRGN